MYTWSHIDFTLCFQNEINHFSVTNPMIIRHFVVVMKFDSLFIATVAQVSAGDIHSADTCLVFYSFDFYYSENHYLYLTGPNIDSLLHYAMYPWYFLANKNTIICPYISSQINISHWWILQEETGQKNIITGTSHWFGSGSWLVWHTSLLYWVWSETGYESCPKRQKKR